MSHRDRLRDDRACALERDADDADLALDVVDRHVRFIGPGAGHDPAHGGYKLV